VVSEVTVNEGKQAARVNPFSFLFDGHIARQVEYWPMPYEPSPGRDDLTEAIPRIP
jgi:hypothetical protein